MEVVNAGDKEYFGGVFFAVQVGHERFKVYGSSDTGAVIEKVGAYCKDKGYTGLLEFRTFSELREYFGGDEESVHERYYPINGGEYYLDIYGLQIEEGFDD